MPEQTKPGAWSWEALKGHGRGLLEDPNALLENPYFNMGMGILSENSKIGGGDPFGAAVQGMRASKLTKQQRLDRERIEKLREELAKLIAMRQAAEAAKAGMPQQSPVPAGSQPTSIMEYMRN